MKIGIVTTWFERGAAYVSRAYMRALSRRHDALVYARGGEKYARRDPNWDMPSVTWGRPTYTNYPTYIHWGEFRRWVCHNKVELLLFNEQNSWDVVLRCIRHLRIPIVSYVDYYTPETVPFFALFDVLLCNTRRHFGVFSGHPQAWYIPWGTDLALFRPQPRPTTDDGVVFFHSSGMNPYRKGTDLLLKAFPLVQGPKKLVIHTQRSLTDFPEIAALARNVPGVRIVTGDVPAPGLYHLGDVYVYPSRLDGIGLTLAEALGCGLPVIATNTAPMNEFVVHGTNGRLVNVERLERREDGYYWPMNICEVPSLATAMQFYVDNRGALAEFKKQARHYAEQKLSWESNAAWLADKLGAVRAPERSHPQGLLRRVRAYERRQLLNRVYFPATERWVRRWVRRLGGSHLKRALVRLQRAIAGQTPI